VRALLTVRASRTRPARGALRELAASAPALALAALAAYALKRFYARASADELRFVLAPTAALVEGLTGARFEHERRESGDRVIEARAHGSD
jgi:hypothetical protein